MAKAASLDLRESFLMYVIPILPVGELCSTLQAVSLNVAPILRLRVLSGDEYTVFTVIHVFMVAEISTIDKQYFKP